MKYILLIPIFIILFSCSDDNNQDEEEVVACFEIDKEVFEIGEELQITNCSTGASSFQFSFGDGSSSDETSPIFSYQDPGVYNIRLTAISDNEMRDITETSITVNSIEDNYIFVPPFSGDSFFPINFNYENNTFSYIENFSNFINASPSRYNYLQIELNTLDFSRKFISDRSYNSGNAFFNTLSNNEKLVYTVRSVGTSIGLKQIRLDANWENPLSFNNSSTVLYGSIENNENLIYYGAWRTTISSDPLFSLFKRPTLEIRDDLGVLLERKLYTEIEQGFIGDIVNNGNGFIAFGGITNPIDSGTFENYRPLIIFLDSNYDYINHISYENTSVSVTSVNDMNGTFNINKLANDNLVLYSHNEFRIINTNGEEIMKFNLPDQPDIQGLITLENGDFILSSENFLRKYDINGNQLKSLKFNGIITPNLVLDGNRIFFASGYNTSELIDGIGDLSLIQTFLGSVDTDLNILDLN